MSTFDKSTPYKPQNTYAQQARAYWEKGYQPIPVKDNKAPVIKKWETFSTRKMTEGELNQFIDRAGEHEIGIACGAASNLTVLDIDLDEQDPQQKYIFDQIRHLLPETPVRQISRKGIKLFFRYNNEETAHFSHVFGGKTIQVFDLLSTKAQVVTAPSTVTNPKDGSLVYYIEVGEQDLMATDPATLPALDPKVLDQIREEVSSISLSTTDHETEPTQKHTSGRNNTFVKQITASIHKGKTNEEITQEILTYDEKHHAPPLFQDPTEQLQGKTKEEKATNFVKNVRKTLKIEPNSNKPPQDIKWGPLLPLEKPAPTKKFTDDLIPTPWRQWITTAAKQAGVPHEMILIPAMIGFGSLIGRKAHIDLHPSGALRTPANLWGAIISSVSTRKTASINLGLQFFHEINRELEQKYQDTKPSRKAELKENEMRTNAVERDLQDAIKNKGDTREIKERLAKLEKERAAIIRRERLQEHDSTVEAMQLTMSDNPNGVLICRDELMGWIINMSKEGRQSERQFYMECWNGTLSDYSVTRIGREPVLIPHLIVSLLGGIQPGPLKALIAKAHDDSTESDGFIQRIQLMICPDSEDIKSTITGPGDNIRINTARPRDLFKRAYRFHPSQITGTSVEEDTVTLTLASDAQPLFYEWAKMIEGISSDDTKSKPFTEHLMKYPTLLSRLTLNLHMIETLDKPDERDFSGTVSKETLDLAIKWCEVLESHAKRVYGIYEQSIGAAAKTLLDRIKSNHIVDGMSFRQIQRKNLRGLSSIEDIEAACQELCDVNAVAVDESMIGRRGKTRSLKLRVNPEILTS